MWSESHDFRVLWITVHSTRPLLFEFLAVLFYYAYTNEARLVPQWQTWWFPNQYKYIDQRRQIALHE